MDERVVHRLEDGSVDSRPVQRNESADPTHAARSLGRSARGLLSVRRRRRRGRGANGGLQQSDAYVDSRGPHGRALCYHAVSETWDVPLAVTASQLAEQLELIARRGYRTVTFHAAVADPAVGADAGDHVRRRVRLRPGAGVPILSSLDMVATVFVVTDLVDAGSRSTGPVSSRVAAPTGKCAAFPGCSSSSSPTRAGRSARTHERTLA